MTEQAHPQSSSAGVDPERLQRHLPELLQQYVPEDAPLQARPAPAQTPAGH